MPPRAKSASDRPTRKPPQLPSSLKYASRASTAGASKALRCDELSAQSATRVLMCVPSVSCLLSSKARMFSMKPVRTREERIWFPVVCASSTPLKFGSPAGIQFPRVTLTKLLMRPSVVSTQPSRSPILISALARVAGNSAAAAAPIAAKKTRDLLRFQCLCVRVLKRASPVGPSLAFVVDWLRNLHLLHFHPLPARRRPLDSVEHALVPDPVFEVRPGRLAVGDGLQEIVNRVRERVLVADDVAGGPPGGDVRVLAVGDGDGA